MNLIEDEGNIRVNCLKYDQDCNGCPIRDKFENNPLLESDYEDFQNNNPQLLHQTTCATKLVYLKKIDKIEKIQEILK